MSESGAGDAGAMLKEMAARLFGDHVTPALLAAAERGEWPERLWNAISQAGLPGALVPEAAGGFGLEAAEALTLLREAGAAGAPVPLAETMLALWLLAGAGLETSGGGPFALIAGPALTLRRAGTGWHLAGHATGIAWGRAARAGAALAEAEGKAYVALLEPASWRAELSANLAGEPRDILHFDAELPAGAVATAPAGIGPLQLRAAGAVARSLEISGALQRITGMSVRYANERRQFGKPIGRFQAIQQNLAILAGQAAAATAAADLGAEAFAAGLRLPSVAVAKSRASEAAGAGAAIAHQVHGAIGFTYEHSLHFLTRRLWAWRDEYGGESEWNALLGRHLANAGSTRLWAGITEL